MRQSLALYIHWPFCRSKCPYCDFNSHVREHIPEARILKALRAELAFEAARLGGRALGSIFFGGGTPSLMAPDSVASLIQDARSAFVADADVEITLEANPTSIEVERFRGYREAGVNRISIGVQSLDDESLRFLGREHSADEALTAIELARSIFPRVSFDLIYARPGQSPLSWQRELDRALSVGTDHLSLYQLTIEPGTKFYTRHQRGELLLPDNEEAAILYDVTNQVAARFGLAAYEISNYAKPGYESRHNLAYWRYQDYAGVGPGAHGRITIGETLLATRRHRSPEEWAKRVEARAHGSVDETPIPPDERAREALLMGLRLCDGIHAGAFAARTGTPLYAAVDPVIVKDAILAGYLAATPDRLVATHEGRKRLDALLAALIR